MTYIPGSTWFLLEEEERPGEEAKQGERRNIMKQSDWVSIGTLKLFELTVKYAQYD